MKSLGLLVCSALLLPVGLAQAGTAELSGIPQITNSSEPAGGRAVVEPKMLWELEDDEDDALFGRIADIVCDDQGRALVLDNQLSQIQVLSDQGDVLEVMGSEGEGPGEFRAPMGAFRLNDGTIGVVQMMPGKLAALNADGEPAGDLPLPRAEGGGRSMLMGAESAGDHVVVQMMGHGFGGNVMTRTAQLVAIDREGSVVGTYYSDKTEEKMSGGNISISINPDEMGVWAAGTDGRVYRSSERNEYSIQELGVDGTIKRVFGREYESRKRTKAEIDEMRETLSRFGGEREIEEIERDIREILVRPSGDVWVLSSHGNSDRGVGVLGTYDVFDPEGNFQKQITLNVDFDPDDDVAYFSMDRLFIVKNGNAALEAGGGGMRMVIARGNASEADDESDEFEPLRILCYDLSI